MEMKFKKWKKKKKKKTQTQTQTSLPVGCHPNIFHSRENGTWHSSGFLQRKWTKTIQMGQV